MNKEQFAKIAIAIRAAYPNATIMADNPTMDLWYQMLRDYDYEIAQNAVLEHISTNKYAPTIAEIREKCADRLTPMITDWSEAWEEVILAIRKFGSYRVHEAVSSMSPITAVAVKRMGFLNLCQSDNPVADRAHFQRIYEGMVKEEKRQSQLPEFVRDERERMIEEHTDSAVYMIEAVHEDSQEQGFCGVTHERLDNLLLDLRHKLGVQSGG